MARPRALLLVRNPFTHDARVLRAAHALSGCGLDPLVVAVTSTEVRRRTETQDGVPVLRLDPTSPFAAPRHIRDLLSGSDRASPRESALARLLERTRAGRVVIRAHRWMRTLDFYRRAFGVVRLEQPTLVHCNDYNTMWVGVLARAFGRATVVYDSHELWPDRNQRPEPRWWLLACEALFVRVAHEVVVASPGYADVLARRYRISRPTVVRNIPARREAPIVAPADEPDVAVYAGALTPHRGLEEAIAALALVPTLRLRFLGPGHADYIDRLRALADRHRVADRVEVHGPLEPHRVVDAVRGAAFGLALFQPVCLSHRLVAPNKLFEYMHAGLPVLASDLPVMRELVEGRRLGLAVPATDVERIAAGARALSDPDSNAPFRRGAAAAAREITWEREREELAASYARAMTRAGAR